MRYSGKKIEAVCETVVIPRAGGNLVFKAKPVTDYKAFEALCPEPKPPVVMLPGGDSRADVNDKSYKFALERHVQRRVDWMILESLSATAELEWETVDRSNPETWGNYVRELETSGLPNADINRIVNAVMDANGLNQKKVEEATKSFLAGPLAVSTGQ
jgi:hypothetical protein